MKLGDENYWQVGDEVYSFEHGKGVIGSFTTCINCGFGDKNVSFKYNEENGFYDCVGQPIFHLKAIEFNGRGQPIRISYSYVPERTTKVLTTKLPHEFVKDEEVLIRDCSSEEWFKSSFSDFFNIKGYAARPYRCFNTTLKTQIFGWAYCIPFKGNEYLEGKVTNCESGKVPDDYVFPKEEHKFKPFDRVLVRSSEYCRWEIDIFSRYNNDDYRYYCIVGSYLHCIPFEGNEHLLGTTNSPEE